MKELFVFVYNKSTAKLANYIADRYHKEFEISYLDETHPDEKKDAIYYKVLAGASKCPFLGYYKDNVITDALWSEASTINEETIDIFFKKFRLNNFK